ncbi:MAG: N-acetylmuramic acid 6-phosphate etherase [Phycisphaerae bacterium]
MDRSELATEQRNLETRDIDTLDAAGIVRRICAADARVAGAVEAAADTIAQLVDRIAERLGRGGRLFYVGAGTSGRLGVLDASECPPTFGTDPEQVQGIIAGGYDALVRSSEGREDIGEDGRVVIRQKGVTAADIVVGIAACGLTPYVRAAVDQARQIGSATGFVTCSPQVASQIAADTVICVEVGPEVIAGSTRMKAGTATKMVLNMLTTGAMIRLGKVYENLMVDLRATNDKLCDRAGRILRELTDLDESAAAEMLARADGQLKTAIVMARLGVGAETARGRLDAAGGHLRRALENHG